MAVLRVTGTSFDPRHPPENVLNPSPSNFFSTTGSFPQRLIAILSAPIPITRVTIRSLAISKITVVLEGSVMGQEKQLEYNSKGNVEEQTADFGAQGVNASRIVIRMESRVDFGAIIHIKIFATGDDVKDADKPLILDPDWSKNRAPSMAPPTSNAAEDDRLSRSWGPGDNTSNSLDVSKTAAASKVDPNVIQISKAILSARQSGKSTELQDVLREAIKAGVSMESHEVLKAQALIRELKQKAEDWEDETTASSTEDEFDEENSTTWGTPADAPSGERGQIRDMLEQAISQLGPDEDIKSVEQYQEMAAQMFQNQTFKSPEWFAWFEKTIDSVRESHGRDEESEDEIPRRSKAKSDWKTPDDAPPRQLDNIADLLEQALANSSPDDDTPIEDYMDMVGEKMDQAFDSNEWHEWFESQITDIHDHIHANGDDDSREHSFGDD